MPKPFNITLPDEESAFIEQAAQRGRHGGPAEYVHALIRQQMERDRHEQALREGIQLGLDDMAAGRYQDLDAEGLRAEMDAIKQEARLGSADAA